jgi:hypothetical protein
MEILADSQIWLSRASGQSLVSSPAILLSFLSNAQAKAGLKALANQCISCDIRRAKTMKNDASQSITKAATSFKNSYNARPQT